MIQKYKKYPEGDEVVICTVKTINPNSILVELDEYGLRGMVHVSEVASTWIRDIRKFARVGQKIVLKVLNVDSSRNVIYLSLKRVKPTRRRQKLSEVKNEKKAENFLKIAAKKINKEPSEIYSRIGFELQKKFGLMYSAFELALSEGKEALVAEGIDSEWSGAIAEVAKKNIKPKEVKIKATLILKSYGPNGLKAIKDSLDIKKKGVIIRYIGAPRYSLEVTGNDYPDCEKTFKDVEQSIETTFKKYGGEMEIKR